MRKISRYKVVLILCIGFGRFMWYKKMNNDNTEINTTSGIRNSKSLKKSNNNEGVINKDDTQSLLYKVYHKSNHN